MTEEVKSKTVVMFDLESTLIEDLNGCNFSTCSILLNFIEQLLFTELVKTQGQEKLFGIFSFAIDDQNDLDDFNKGLSERLRKTLRIDKFTFVPTVWEVMQVVKQARRIDLEIGEVKQIFGKENSFIEWCVAMNKAQPELNDFILIDDVVRTQNIVFLLESGDALNIAIFNIEDIGYI